MPNRDVGTSQWHPPQERPDLSHQGGTERPSKWFRGRVLAENLPFPSFAKRTGTRWTLVGPDGHVFSPGTPRRKRAICAITDAPLFRGAVGKKLVNRGGSIKSSVLPCGLNSS